MNLRVGFVRAVITFKVPDFVVALLMATKTCLCRCAKTTGDAEELLLSGVREHVRLELPWLHKRPVASRPLTPEGPLPMSLHVAGQHIWCVEPGLAYLVMIFEFV